MMDYSREELDYILSVADKMVDLEKTGSDLAKGKVLGSMFFEPSTRTRLSFETAMMRLGGSVTTVADPMTSSAKKGETFEDTISTISNYVDIIAMRHPDNDAALRAKKVAKVPYLNGGSGTWEHPTQTMLDLHCIRYAKSKIDGLTIGMVGDLKNGRTVHSLLKALRHYDVTVYCIAPDALKMKPEVIEEVKDYMKVIEVSDLPATMPKLDVVYMTRVQRERFASQEEYDKVKDSYIMDKKMIVDNGKKDVVIMHPLPRVNEITTDVDDMPNAWYFRQVKHGIYARMAIIALALGLWKD
ncbi:aspartate carbamoyltransferase [Candidatus Bathyarchaeota archaeon]|nr:MAG: aspartate carbamoyltransferase [Candidatus Bathyarchaeota archaeon]